MAEKHIIQVHLEEQNHGFAKDKKLPVEGAVTITQDDGRGSIELKVKNLRKNNIPYRLFLLGRKNGSSVYTMAGEVVPDECGIATLMAETDIRDVDGEGTDLQSFYIYMLAAMGRPVQPVLKGDLMKVAAKNPTGGLQYNGYYREYIREKTEALKSKAKNFADMSPFDDVWLSDKWKRVTDMSLFPVASSGAEKQVRKYGHYIFAVLDDRFFLAVPGRHVESEWPDQGKSGFLLWQPICGSQEYGYWCMVIDWKTGIIVEIS